MIKVTGVKNDFIPITKESDNEYIVRWDKKDEIEIIYEIDEFGERVLDENEQPIPTGKTKETQFATWWVEKYPYKPTSYIICEDIKKSGSNLIPSDIKSISEFLGESKEETERRVRDFLIEAITRYDLSDEVNSLYLNGNKAWFDKTLRNSIERQIIARKNAGQLTAPIIFNEIILQIPVDLGLKMLEQLEIYASDCYNQTMIHKNKVSTMSLDEMLVYDYTTGYPEKLKFEFK